MQVSASVHFVYNIAWRLERENTLSSAYIIEPVSTIMAT